MRHKGGRTLYAGQTEGPDLAFAMREHLYEFADLHDLFIEEDGGLKEGASMRVVWEIGDTCADFGDFMIHAVYESDLTDKQKAVLIAAGVEEIEDENEAF